MDVDGAGVLVRVLVAKGARVNVGHGELCKRSPQPFSVPVCPGVRTVFAATPVTLNPAPEAVTPEIVTFALPVFVSVAISEFVLPTVTAPKLNVPVLDVSAGVGLATALPAVAIVSGEFGASLTSAIEPLAFPAAAGANTTLNVALCPAAI